MARRKNFSRGAGRGYVREDVSRAPRAGGGGPPPRARKRRRDDYSVYEREAPSPEYMRRLFARHELEVEEEQLERFWRYYLLLRRENRGLHLTRIIGIEATVLKHCVDCAVVADLARLRGPLLDIGSGPGFPGVPLAIRCPGLEVILAESRGTRVRFLRLLQRELALANLRLFPRSVRRDSPFAPAAGDGEGPRAAGAWRVRSVITRALERIPLTLERVRGFLPPGGEALFMKGPNCGDEVSEARRRFRGVFRVERDLRYSLGRSRQRRRLVVFARC